MLGSASHDSCIDSVIKKESLFALDYYQESRHGLLSILNEVRGNESVNFEKTMNVLLFPILEYSTASYPIPRYLSTSVCYTMFKSVIGQLLVCCSMG